MGYHSQGGAEKQEDTGFHAEYEQITGAVVSIFEAWQKENGVESAATSLHRLIDALEQNRIDELRTIAENQEEHREQMKAAFREIEETMNAMAKMPPITVWRFMRLILTAHWQLPGSRKSWSRNGR